MFPKQESDRLQPFFGKWSESRDKKKNYPQKAAKKKKKIISIRLLDTSISTSILLENSKAFIYILTIKKRLSIVPLESWDGFLALSGM